MKISVVVLLLSGILLSGCGSSGAQMRSAADSVEKMLQSAGNAVETAVLDPSTVTETISGPLTRERAEAIALEHAGFSADQITRLRSEYEIDDGVPRFEVRFRQGRWEYDYEINADTGAILSWDRDD